MITQEFSWVLRSTYENSGASRRPHKHSWIWCHGTMSIPECSWVLISHAHESTWALTRPHECLWHYGIMLRSIHGSSWLLMAAYVWSWVIESAHDCSWVHMIPHEHSWAGMTIHEHSWVMDMGMAPWWQENSWALIGPKKALWAWYREHAWASKHHRTILLSPPKCSGVLRTTSECT